MQLFSGPVGIAIWALGWQVLWLLTAHGCNPDTKAQQQLPRRAFETPLVGREVHFPDISRRNDDPVGIFPVRRNGGLNEPRDPIAADSFLTNSGAPNNNAVPGVMDAGDDEGNDDGSSDADDNVVPETMDTGDDMDNGVDGNDEESGDGSGDTDDKSGSVEPSEENDDVGSDTAVPSDQTSQLVEKRDDGLGFGLGGGLTGRKPCPCGCPGCTCTCGCGRFPTVHSEQSMAELNADTQLDIIIHKVSKVDFDAQKKMTHIG
ncbi:hypothetical protein IWQ62_001295 [Dispira parvispora]|uniref:Uncharacterized protein n=1 Tax=Dispira parvispora TaxID=1520584 RepID=A0A9W8E983_9FUNG|nr:hypothetical protein IWQ62_001295 [Dispira parvispora]